MFCTSNKYAVNNMDRNAELRKNQNALYLNVHFDKNGFAYLS